VGAVDVGVGHQDDAVVAQLLDIELVAADAAAERGDERADLGAAEHLVEARLLDVQDLALERQDGLGAAVAALLGGAACRVALDDEEFGARGIAFLAIGELAGEAGDVERTLAAGELAGLARGLAGARGLDDLAGDGLGFLRVLQQELGELRGDGGLDHALHFARDEFIFGLRGELGVGELDGQDGGEALARVVAGGRDLLALGDALFFDVVVQRARERGAETREVRTAVLLRDVVGVAEHGLRVGVVPLHRDLDADRAFLGAEPEHALVDRALGAVEVRDEGLQAARVLEGLGLAVALVVEVDAHAGVEERELAQALGEDVVVELDVREDGRRRLEAHAGAGAVGGADHGERRDGIAEAVFLRVQFAAAMDGELQHIGERVDDGHADAVQTTGDFVGAVVELTARVQHGHDDFGGGATFFGVDVDRDAAAVVVDADGFVGVDRDGDAVAVTGQRFVDGVVDDLENHVVQTGAIVGVADVHPGPLANGVEAF